MNYYRKDGCTCDANDASFAWNDLLRAQAGLQEGSKSISADLEIGKCHEPASKPLRPNARRRKTEAATQSCCYVTLRFVTLRYVTLRYGPPRRRLRPSAMPPWRPTPYTHGAPRRVLGGAAAAPANSCSWVIGVVSFDPLVLDHPPIFSLASRRAPSWQVRLGLRYVT